jgi:hypothetical protein
MTGPSVRTTLDAMSTDQQVLADAGRASAGRTRVARPGGDVVRAVPSVAPETGPFAALGVVMIVDGGARGSLVLREASYGACTTTSSRRQTTF